MVAKQKLGQSSICLWNGGEVFISSTNNEDVAIEQILEERDKKLEELEYIAKSCKS